MYDDPEPEKPEHCIEGHIAHWYDEWENEDGEMSYDEGAYFECTKWEPGYPPLMSTFAHVTPRAYTRDED
jgi:hypothetical protein